MSDFSDSDAEEDDSLAETRLFNQAADHIQHIHSRIGQADLLQLYGLYKQSTAGDCPTSSQPSIFNMQARTKWKAWHELQGITSDMAKQRYVTAVGRLDPDWSVACAARHKAPAGSSRSERTGWVVHSIEARPADDELPEEQKTAFDYVRESNLASLKALSPPLSAAQLNELDEHGMGLIHWASDHNRVEILRHLLKAGAPVGLRDSDEQTALHYAASCGHLECVHVLLEFKADVQAKDADGQTCVDVAESARVRWLLER